MEHLDKIIRALVLILPKMGEYTKTFKVKDRVKDKNSKLRNEMKSNRII